MLETQLSSKTQKPDYHGLPVTFSGMILFFFFFEILFLINLKTQHGARTHNPEIKSHVFHRLNQPGVPVNDS